MHLGYKLARIYHYLRNASAEQFQPDPNDAEDSLICVYLDVLFDTTLVTNDKGTRDAVNATRRAFDCRMCEIEPKLASHDLIAARAYEIFCQSAADADANWYAAERELRELKRIRSACRVIDVGEFLSELEIVRQEPSPPVA
jgi:hypothetical protein